MVGMVLCLVANTEQLISTRMYIVMYCRHKHVKGQVRSEDNCFIFVLVFYQQSPQKFRICLIANQARLEVSCLICYPHCSTQKVLFATFFPKQEVQYHLMVVSNYSSYSSLPSEFHYYASLQYLTFNKIRGKHETKYIFRICNIGRWIIFVEHMGIVC